MNGFFYFAIFLWVEYISAQLTSLSSERSNDSPKVTRTEPQTTQKIENEISGSSVVSSDEISTQNSIVAQLKGELEALKEELHKAQTKRYLGLEEIGKLKYELKMKSNGIWYETIRSAIENFEDDHTKNANISFPSYEEEMDITIRRCIFRERKWKWIFQNKQNEERPKTYRLDRLIEKINASKDVTSTDEFATLIARAFSELSEYLHRELLTPGYKFGVEFSTTDPKVKCAIELFMDLFEIREIIAVPKRSSS